MGFSKQLFDKCQDELHQRMFLLNRGELDKRLLTHELNEELARLNDLKNQYEEQLSKQDFNKPPVGILKSLDFKKEI